MRRVYVGELFPSLIDIAILAVRLDSSVYVLLLATCSRYLVAIVFSMGL